MWTGGAFNVSRKIVEPVIFDKLPYALLRRWILSNHSTRICVRIVRLEHTLSNDSGGSRAKVIDKLQLFYTTLICSLAISKVKSVCVCVAMLRFSILLLFSSFWIAHRHPFRAIVLVWDLITLLPSGEQRAYAWGAAKVARSDCEQKLIRMMCGTGTWSMWKSLGEMRTHKTVFASGVKLM